MKKRFRPHDPDQGLLLPPSLGDWLPEDHLVHFIKSVVEELDLKAIYASYESTRGRPPYSPKMMLGIWLYAYCQGIRSSRRVERALYEDVGFRVLAANQQPDFWTLNQFRSRHMPVLKSLFVQTIRLGQRAGLLALKQVAVDGTKVKANASKHAAMSYKRMSSEEKRLQAEVDRYFEEAEAIDAEEDREFGKRRGNELPEHLNTPGKRLEAIRRAKRELEEEAKERARAEQDERRRKAEEEGRPFYPRSDPDKAKPSPKSQRNFTDPDSRIMVNGDKAFVQAYNAQLAVDVDSQLIVAADLSNLAPDAPHLTALVDQVLANTGDIPNEVSADAGYFSEENIRHIEALPTEALIPPERLPHNEWKQQAAASGRIPISLSLKERMRRKLRTSRGRSRYKRRQCSVEPVLGQIKQGRGLRQFLHRGLEKVKDSWFLDCIAHNLLKLFRSGLALSPT